MKSNFFMPKNNMYVLTHSEVLIERGNDICYK